MKLKNTIYSKNKAIAALLLCGLSCSALAASDTATITVTGKVLANTCTLDDASAKQTIDLTAVSAKDIVTGKAVNVKDVVINLTGCGGDTKGVKVTAKGTPDGKDTMAFKNLASGTDSAGGVGLYFLKTDASTPFSAEGNVSETSELTPSIDNQLTYKAGYVGTGDDVKAGGFTTTVNLTFDYQ